MANQIITVEIPAGETVLADLGIIITLEGRVVATSATTNDPKILLMMLEQARNEIDKVPANLVSITGTKGLRRS